jgi:hypothetical protein
MLLIAFEPAFSGKILKKLDKELKKVNDPFFLIICIVIKSFSYIQMGLQKLQNLFADVGNNALDIQTLETMGSGSVWFDAWRYVHFINISS